MTVSPDLHQSFHGRPHSFPYSVEPTCGVWVSKNHQRPYKKRFKSRRHCQIKAKAILTKLLCLGPTQNSEWILIWVDFLPHFMSHESSEKISAASFPKIPSERRGLGRTDGWMDVGCTAVSWMKCPHYCWYLKEIVRNEPSKSPRNVEIAARENGAVCSFCQPSLSFQLLKSQPASFKATSSSTRAMMQHSLVFFHGILPMKHVARSNNLEQIDTLLFFGNDSAAKHPTFFILSRRGVKFSQTSISSTPFALTIRTIYCKVSVMLSWAPQRIYISILLSITIWIPHLPGLSLSFLS